MRGDIKPTTRGTGNYRAPELKHEQCKNPYAADIYSLGVLLFTFTFGCMPYLENDLIDGVDLYEAILFNKKLFWEVH